MLCCFVVVLSLLCAFVVVFSIGAVLPTERAIEYALVVDNLYQCCLKSHVVCFLFVFCAQIRGVGLFARARRIGSQCCQVPLVSLSFKRRILFDLSIRNRSIRLRASRDLDRVVLTSLRQE